MNAVVALFKGAGGIWPAIYLCLFTFLLGVGITGFLAWKLSSGSTAKYELKVETQHAAGLMEGMTTMRQADQALEQRLDGILAAVGQIPAIQAQADSKLAKIMKETTQNASFDCRRLPLPDEYLDGLRRISPADGHSGP